jgi:hypothetical protein
MDKTLIVNAMIFAGSGAPRRSPETCWSRG